MHSIRIDSDSWMNRMYEVWVKSGGKRPSQPTLCHFFWVVILWGPVRWFFHKPSSLKASPAQKVGITLGCLMAVGAVIAMVLKDPKILLTWLIIAATLGLIIGSIRLWDGFLEPRFGEKLMNAWLWTTETRKTRFGISPLYVLVACAIIALIVGSILSTKILKVMLVALAVIVVLALLVLVVGIASYLKDRLAERRMNKYLAMKHVNTPIRKKRVANAKRKTTSTLGVVVGYVKMRKDGSRICPFIEISDQAEA